jgi:DNA-binding transcriptional regulator GbsR (MarR family)
MSLRALEDWGVIQRVRVPGNRREFFRSPGDVWQLFHAVVRERKRREFDPMVRSLRQFVKDAGDSPSDPALALYQTRVGALLGVLEVLDHIFERALPSDPKELPRVFEVTVEGLE